MADRDKDLVHLFVSDLDDIELPPRDSWRPAPRKESHLRKTSRYVLYASAAAAVLVLALLASFALRGGDHVAATPSPASPTNTASPATSGRYASPGLGYSIETPPPWHRSTCLAAVVTQEGATPTGDEFVPVPARDETTTDIGPAYPVVRVFVLPNPQGLSPRQVAEQGQIVGGPTSQGVDDVTYADRPAARKSLPGDPLVTYFVANGGRMYVVNPHANTPPDTTTQQTMIRMIESFRFLTDAEQAATRAAVPSPLPPRTAEQVADGVAAAMSAKDVDALAGFLAPCVTNGREQAGATTVTREKYVDELRAAFAAGLAVTVRTRPLEERAPGVLTVTSTWRDPRGTLERKLMFRPGQNDRWEWWGGLDQ